MKKVIGIETKKTIGFRLLPSVIENAKAVAKDRNLRHSTYIQNIIEKQVMRDFKKLENDTP